MTTIAEKYFGAYLSNATNNTSPISTISNIPRDVPLETLIALASFKPEVYNGTILQRYGQNLPIIQSNITKELLAINNQTVNGLNSFTPRVLSGNAIQRRRINGVLVQPSPRDIILKGVDPKTKKLVRQLEDLKFLNDAVNRLNKLAQKLETQINKFSALFNALVNAPDAIASAVLTALINKLQQLEDSYTKVKRVLELAIKAAKAIKKAILKALFEDLPKAKKKIKDGIDLLGKILTLKEIPRIIRFPKFPKIPSVNLTKANFFAKYKKALEILKKKDGEFYQKAYAKAVQQAGFEIQDPNKDKIQRGLTQARNSLRKARADLQTSQAIRTEAVNRARNDLINQVRNVTSNVSREQAKIMQQYQNIKLSGSNAIATGSAKFASGSNAIKSTINEARTLANATTTAINSTLNVASSLNSKVVGSELSSGISNALQESTRLANFVSTTGSINR